MNLAQIVGLLYCTNNEERVTEELVMPVEGQRTVVGVDGKLLQERHGWLGCVRNGENKTRTTGRKCQ